MTEEIKNNKERKTNLVKKTRRANTKKENLKQESKTVVRKTTKRPYNKKNTRKYNEKGENSIFKKSKLKIIPLRRNTRSWKKYYSFWIW